MIQAAKDKDLGEILAEAAAAAERADEEHRRACDPTTPCERCGRYRCVGGFFSADEAERRCAAVVDRKGQRCAACARDRALVVLEERTPVRYRWTLRPATRDESIRRCVALPTERIAAALEWAARQGLRPCDLAVLGPARHGKTSIAIAMLGAWFAANHARHPELVSGARFVDALELSRARRRHRLREGGDPVELDEAIAASLLVLDDLGQDEPEGLGDLKYVIRARNNADRPTWITTWLNRHELVDRYGGGLIERLMEHAQTIRIPPRTQTADARPS